MALQLTQVAALLVKLALQHRQIQLHQHLAARHRLSLFDEQLAHLAAGTGVENAGVVGVDQHAHAFHLGGHTNHSIFWKNLTPESQERPSGELASAINEYFGSFDKFRAHFNAAALGLQGSGWAFLAWDAIGGQLIIEQLYDQQGNIAAATTPLLMLDMWEHAFYLDYKNVKGDYVTAFWNIINWDDVAKRFAAARSGAAGLLLV
jgi:Fe-Mn family superoxide dismutase